MRHYYWSYYGAAPPYYTVGQRTSPIQWQPGQQSLRSVPVPHRIAHAEPSPYYDPAYPHYYPWCAPCYKWDAFYGGCIYAGFGAC